MKDFDVMDYATLMPVTYTYEPEGFTGEFTEHKPVQGDWGKVKIADLSLPDIRIVKFDGAADRSVCFQKRVPGEATTVDTCIFLEGTIDSDFPEYGRMSLRKGMQQFMYMPDLSADHYIATQEELQILHISVDRFYYANLLSDHERWSADLKEKLLNKKPICGSRENTNMNSQMLRVVTDILNCPLQGNLRTIVLEAKVIEFLALQLNKLAVEGSAIENVKIKKEDRDSLYALYDYLGETFKSNHSLRNLSRQFGLNEFKLKKGFKELFGTTVFEYLHDLKMDFARKMLEEGEILVNEVSGMVGYRNPNHFSTAFKRKYGVNPRYIKN